MAKKGPMQNYETIDAYISIQSEKAKKYLEELRIIIKDAAPGAEEIINYKIPSFRLIPEGKRDHQIMMAAYEKFVGFYPFPSTIEKFKSELKEFKKGKGSVQFPYDKPLPKDLITKMVKFRRNEILKCK